MSLDKLTPVHSYLGVLNMFSTARYLFTALVALALYILNRLLNNYSALRKLNLPGPFLAKLSSKWLLVTFMRGAQMITQFPQCLKL